MLALPVAMLFPALWAMSPSRMVAALVSACYFLAASRGLPLGVANFYSADLWPGFLLWFATSLSFVAVHAVAWTLPIRGRPEEGRLGRGRLGRPARYLAAALLMALPPFGITGWAHPLTAAGVLFPGWGWWGLLATAAGLLTITTRYRPAAAIGLAGFWLWSAATWTEPNLPEGWSGVDLEYGQTLGRDGALDHHRGLIATARKAAGESVRVVVFPESTLGFWTPTVARLWREGLNGLDVTIVAGAAVIDARGYDNVMVAFGSGAEDILYKERMPVPVSMWQPWLRWTGQGGGAQAHLFARPGRGGRDNEDRAADLL